MLDIPEEFRHRPFTRAEALAAGLTRRQLAGQRFVQICHNVHVVVDLDLTLELRARAVGLVLPCGSVVADTTAAWLRGADIRAPNDVMVDVVVPSGDQLRRRGIRAREALVDPGDVSMINGVPAMSAIRTAFDLARQTDLVEAVVAVDALANKAGVTLEDLRHYIDRHGGWRGVRYAEETLGFAEPKSQSPMESRQRMALVLAGLPRPEAQIELYDSPVLAAVLDNGYRPFRVGTDYDGHPHEGTMIRDIERQQWVRDQDWWHRRYTRKHYRAGWGQMIVEVRRALLARGYKPGDMPCCPLPNPRRVFAPYGLPWNIAT